jgi:hypothetical protein
MREATKMTRWHPSTSVPLFYKGKKKRDDNDILSEVYKLHSNNPKNKNLVEIHKDNGGYSIKFTVDKTIPEFNQGAEKCGLTWVDSFTEFENVLQGQHRTAWKQTLHEHFLEPVDATRPVPSDQDRNSDKNCRRAILLFLQRTLNKKSLEIGNTFTYSLEEIISSKRR